MYSSEDLKQVKTIRDTNFWKQFKLLFLRVVIGFWRQPLFIGGVFGNALFAVLLISSMYNNTGAFNLSWDMNKNKKAIKDWLGLSFYIGNDIFAWSLFSTVIPIPIRVPLYRKERLSGMFSAHSYYFSLWIG